MRASGQCRLRIPRLGRLDPWHASFSNEVVHFEHHPAEWSITKEGSTGRVVPGGPCSAQVRISLRRDCNRWRALQRSVEDQAEQLLLRAALRSARRLEVRAVATCDCWIQRNDRPRGLESWSIQAPSGSIRHGVRHAVRCSHTAPSVIQAQSLPRQAQNSRSPPDSAIDSSADIAAGARQDRPPAHFASTIAVFSVCSAQVTRRRGARQGSRGRGGATNDAASAPMIAQEHPRRCTRRLPGRVMLSPS